MVTAVGQHQQRLGLWRHRGGGVEEPATQVGPEGRVTWFERKEAPNFLGEPTRLCALAGGVNALKDNKTTGH